MSIYLRFMTERLSIESSLIRFGTRSWASHVEFVRCDTSDEPVETLGSRLDGGVKIRPYDYCRPSREEWWSASHLQDAWAWGLTRVGEGYDWYNILGLPLNQDWHADGHWICSEFVAACGEKRREPDGSFVPNGFPWLNPRFETWRVTPRDLLLSPALSFFRRVV